MKLIIPQANPRAEVLEIADEIQAAINTVLNGGRYILGPEVETFEKEFATFLGVKYAAGVASGTDAIHLGLRALNIGAGDEVITVAHTAVASVAAIEMCGADPVLVDIEPGTFTMNPDEVEKRITSRTRAILPVHLYGHPADMDSILRIAKEHGAAVLEDCAQAHGAKYFGARVGSLGDAASFSFYPTKNLGAIGDGGLIASNDFIVAERARLLREYGWRERYISTLTGFNSRLDEIQAAMLRVKLHHLEDNNRRRRELAGQYTSAICGLMRTPVEKLNCVHVYHQYVIRCPERDELKAFLLSKGIGTLVHYPVPVHLQPAYRGRLGDTGSLPVTESIAREILSLPMFPQLRMQDVEIVCKAIEEFAHAGR